MLGQRFENQYRMILTQGFTIRTHIKERSSTTYNNYYRLFFLIFIKPACNTLIVCQDIAYATCFHQIAQLNVDTLFTGHNHKLDTQQRSQT